MRRLYTKGKIMRGMHVCCCMRKGLPGGGGGRGEAEVVDLYLGPFSVLRRRVFHISWNASCFFVFFKYMKYIKLAAKEEALKFREEDG